MTGQSTPPPDEIERSQPAEPGADSTADPATPRRRTHPITPLVTGWKLVVGVIAVITAQNVARMVEDFTVQRALIGAGLLVVAVLIAIAISTLSWWFTSYAVDEDGVSLHTGMISRSREYAPRARIESVSVERPLLARLLGLAKVRVEVAGGGESYLDIEYVKSADAEELRRGILGVAALTGTVDGLAETAPDASGSAPVLAQPQLTTGAQTSVGAGPGDGLNSGHDQNSGVGLNSGHDQNSGAGLSGEGGEASGESSTGRLQGLLYDGVTDGELIASIPTERLVRSLLRDVSFLTGVVMSLVGVVVAVLLAIWQEGINIAMFIALAPAAIAVPKYVFGRIESGWGFVSRITDRGLRMRRGLANTRTDNIASGRIQSVELRRPLLWRAPDWTAVSVTVAGIDDDDENGASNVLPVGTTQELRSTLGHLAAPLGTADDLATIEHLLSAPAREIDGLRTETGLYWISRRTRVTVLLPGALVHRSGILARRLEIIPRERIQQLSLEDDPIGRKLGILELQVKAAGDTLSVTDLPRQDVLALHAVLRRDARTLRRYRDRGQRPQPAHRHCADPEEQR